MIIEKITSKPYHEVLHDYILNPLIMNHTDLSQYSEPAVKSKHPVVNIYMDQFVFMKSLVDQRIIQQRTLELMHQ